MGTPITTGYMTVDDYFNAGTCSATVYNTNWVQLGFCGIYHSNSSDPYAPDSSCGSFVSTAVYNLTTNSTGEPYFHLKYSFYLDSACTIPGNANGNETCARAQNVYAGCHTETYDGITSTLFAKLVDTYTPPSVGYNLL